jgi:hypothetical protein
MSKARTLADLLAASGPAGADGEDGEDGAAGLNGTNGADAELSTDQENVLSHWRYDPITRKLITDRAIETTLNSLYLGEQHKMSSGSENIYFTNLTSDINFFPMWGGLKDQSITVNQGPSGFIPPSGRVYSDMFSLPLGGSPDPTTSVGYAGNNYFGINISGLGITTVAAEQVDADVRLEYRITISGRQVYMQELPRNAARSSAGTVVYPGDVIEWFFDHPVDVHAGTTLFAEIHKVRNSDDVDLGIFQVRQGDVADATTGLYRYQATVHNRLYEDKDLELISPYLKYKAMDFSVDSTGGSILLKDLSLATGSQMLVPHAINTLQAVASGTEIQIRIKDGAKIIIESLPVAAASINGSFVNSVLNNAVTDLNNLFTNTLSFASQGNPVTSFGLSGNNLTLGLADSTSYSVDVTSLGVDTNNFVASGVLNGTDLILTMDDATTVTVDASTLAVDTDTTISFGSLVGNTLTLTASDSSTVTIDVTSLNVDTNDFVVSGSLNADGINLDLLMNSGTTIQVAVGSLAIDNNTTITGGAVVGTDIQLTLSDSSIITIDASSLDTGTSTQVVSGAVVGTDLVLTMGDSSTVTINAVNMINGSTMSAVNDSWYISYGANANQPVASDTIDTTGVGGVELRLQGPYYFGQSFIRGSEFQFNMQIGNQLRLGIWDGAEVATSYTGSPSMAEPTNWNTVFSFANGTGKFTDSTNTDVTTYHASGYTAVQSAPMTIRFGEDGHLTLIDLSGGTETIVAKTILALSVTSFNMQFGGFNNSIFPNAIIKDSGWSIVHDFDGSEAGLINGIENHTVLRSDLSIVPGEKILFMLDEAGSGDYFGTGYTGATTGVSTAEEQLVNIFQYQTNESILGLVGGASDWNFNVNSTGYFVAGGGSIPSYREGNAGNIQGLFSLRYLADNSLEIYSEEQNEVVATAKVDGDGTAIYLHYGVQGNRAYYSIPVISKQTIGAGSQPHLTFAPDISDQTFAVVEGTAFNFQIALDANSDIVNMYGEVDAPTWAVLNQTSGQFIGTAPAHNGTSDSYVVNCKAGNAIGGITNFVVTINVTLPAYTNAKSLSFDGSTEWLQGNPLNVTALERATNGDGNAWTISMWVKPDTSNTGTQTLMVYGAGDDYNGGAITLKQSGGTTLVLNYGTVYDNIILVAANSFVNNTWQHLMVTFDGGTTGSLGTESGAYYSRFSLFVDGVSKFKIGVASNGGYSGNLSGAVTADNIFRIGRANNIHNNYFDGIINQVAIWDTDQTANLSTIYNSGAVQNLSLLAAAPAHYYEIESSVTTIADIEGSATLTGYNFVSGDLVTDAP